MTAPNGPGGLFIEPCGMVHVALLADLHAVLFPDSWDAEAFRTLMATPGTLGFLATGEDAPVGMVVGRVAADECEILTIGVISEARQRGIAGALLDALVEAVRRAGAWQIFLEVGLSNEAARRLYASRRFYEVARRPGYYGSQKGPREDALVLRLDLAGRGVQ